MKKTKILVCDDDQEMLEMVELTLSLYDFEVHTEIDSRKFFKAVEKFRPDCILLDLWMPIISGQQLLESLKKSGDNANIPVIVFSASRDGQEIAKSAGANSFIAKPFDIEKLVDLLKTVS